MRFKLKTGSPTRVQSTLISCRYVARTLEWIPEEFRGGLWTSTPRRRSQSPPPESTTLSIQERAFGSRAASSDVSRLRTGSLWNRGQCRSKILLTAGDVSSHPSPSLSRSSTVELRPWTPPLTQLVDPWIPTTMSSLRCYAVFRAKVPPTLTDHFMEQAVAPEDHLALKRRQVLSYSKSLSSAVARGYHE
ncbi:hypothetical protein OE88DRAFT_1532197 [Heliocybe sulcata]|uniref:Uncharacterized protein n=1 Tax=Heliocybe sulcata TaxID=5364 RepID=A0A5C3N232_9AGAM|nr:hypothetical protein OE88DRAFT_1532197 [Heliocybe sulcata]